MSRQLPDPRRGEIWLTVLDPTRGSELAKTRPAVVVGSDGLRALPLRLVAPITEWKKQFGKSIWLVPIQPNTKNGLSKPSVVDTLQLRGLAVERFKKRLGRISAEDMMEVISAIVAEIEYQ